MGLFTKLFRESQKPKTAAVIANVLGRRILIVDPSITIQKVIELSLPGATIVAAKDAKEADRRAAHRTVRSRDHRDRASDRTGYDLCSTIKSSGSTPVIHARDAGCSTRIARSSAERRDPRQALRIVRAGDGNQSPSPLGAWPGSHSSSAVLIVAVAVTAGGIAMIRRDRDRIRGSGRSATRCRSSKGCSSNRKRM
jgi:CheY-like chemotaxis protein